MIRSEDFAPCQSVHTGSEGDWENTQLYPRMSACTSGASGHSHTWYHDSFHDTQHFFLTLCSFFPAAWAASGSPRVSWILGEIKQAPPLPSESRQRGHQCGLTGNGQVSSPRSASVLSPPLLRHCTWNQETGWQSQDSSCFQEAGGRAHRQIGPPCGHCCTPQCPCWLSGPCFWSLAAVQIKDGRRVKTTGDEAVRPSCTVLSFHVLHFLGI